MVDPNPIGGDSRGPARPAPASGNALRVANVSKTFPGTRALHDVSFDVKAGSIHALVGGNGSGKSTLIKILAGAHRGDAGGTLEAGGSQVDSDTVTPRWSRAAGIHVVHQELGLFDSLSVAENMMLDGGYPSRVGAVSWRRVIADAKQALERLGISLDVSLPVGSLGPAQKAYVAIARALRDEDRSSLLILDEPTAPLPDADVRVLLSVMREVASKGVGLLFVTHRLEEVIDVADHVTALRDGEHVETRSMDGLGEADLVQLVVGRPLSKVYPEQSHHPIDDPILRVEGLEGGAVRGVDFSIGRGEILGVGGLVGSGRSTLLHLLFGLQEIEAGRVELAGREFRPSGPPAAMERGIGFVPEDRAASGSFNLMTVLENLSMTSLSRYEHLYWVNGAEERRDGDADMTRLKIRAPSLSAPMYQLSGGNQQKVIVARWLRQDMKVFLLDEPTVGVDISSRAEIYQVLRKAAEAGMSVMIVSSDYEELAGVCDRVMVMSKGRIVAGGRPPDIDRHWIAEQSHKASAAASELTSKGASDDVPS